MIITCPKCFSADDVQPPRRFPDHLLQYRCTNETAHGSHEWLTNREAVQPVDEVREGVTDELLEPLSQCVLTGDPFVEYGIVEHRLRTRFPDLFAAHVAEQGHSMFGESRTVRQLVKTNQHAWRQFGRLKPAAPPLVPAARLQRRIEPQSPGPRNGSLPNPERFRVAQVLEHRFKETNRNLGNSWPTMRQSPTSPEDVEPHPAQPGAVGSRRHHRSLCPYLPTLHVAEPIWEGTPL